MSQPVLELQGLEISLPRGADRAHAVERVDLTVRPGEIVCLVGESGSGKSAIAHTIMGLQGCFDDVACPIASIALHHDVNDFSRAHDGVEPGVCLWRTDRRSLAYAHCTNGYRTTSAGAGHDSKGGAR
jgi:ABC-type branched-subunit amino acid transport system ATPase component